MTNGITSDDVQAYLRRIVEAGIFENGSLRYRLLDHLIQTELNGNGDSLKAYTIGLDVFDKPDTFDPSTDSSVRVGIGRLRAALALFESSDKADINLIVDVPVGKYRPVLKRRTTVPTAKPATPIVENPQPKPRRFMRGKLIWGGFGFLFGLSVFAGFYLWRDLASDNAAIALEIENFTGDQSLAMQTSSSLRRIFSRNEAITVISDNIADQVTDESDLILNGHVNLTQGGTVEVSVELTSADSNTVLWAKVSSFPDDALLLPRIEQALGHEIRVQVFDATRAELENRDPKSLTPEQLYIMATWRMGTAVNAIDWDLERVRLMRLALEKDPDFGAAHAVLADRMAYLANVHAPSNTQELRAEALAHAQRARELSPLNPDVMFAVGQTFWHSGQTTDSASAMERVIELNDSHIIAKFLSVMIPYTCAPAPDEIVQWALDFDAKLSRESPTRWMIMTWIALLHTNREEYVEALLAEEEAALLIEVPYTFMRRALLLHKLGRIEEAVDVIRAQKRNWPDLNPAYFAEVTNPRLCLENENHPQLIENYRELAAALDGKI